MVLSFIAWVFSTLFKMFSFVTRRGSGFFKVIFSIDNLFRKFTMSLLIPGLIFFLFPGHRWLMTIGLILGLIIDIEDFLSELQG
ncbi:hypothetical protein COY95_02480 [Candidatus Woesearchaeota archaeon CG_4_10_14_0_8_um_filter_47_5]|nr:MAG: hypothetical protein COY95_02480 [Candidatus Woesearchaeota archaeon CG_4_10_14_0_8_um_filter_47_5]